MNKTGKRFSNIPTDQNYEQVNKDLKSSGGISGLLNTTVSLERFLVSAPIISQMIQEFEKHTGYYTIEDFDSLNPHSESKALQKRFLGDCEKVVKAMQINGNPFIEYNDITSLVTKQVSECSEKIKELEEMGENQFQ